MEASILMKEFPQFSLNPMFLTEEKKGLIIFLAAGTAAIVTVLVSTSLILGPLSFIHDERQAEAIADNNQRDIEQEFRQISPLPRAAVIQHGSMRKTDHGIISAAYKTEVSYESIKLYYHNELKSRGWSVRREVGIKYDGKDYGGKELVYCKSGYAAHLQYAGRQETEFGWTFSFAMTWGHSDECK